MFCKLILIAGLLPKCVDSLVVSSFGGKYSPHWRPSFTQCSGRRPIVLKQVITNEAAIETESEIHPNKRTAQNVFSLDLTPAAIQNTIQSFLDNQNREMIQETATKASPFASSTINPYEGTAAAAPPVFTQMNIKLEYVAPLGFNGDTVTAEETLQPSYLYHYTHLLPNAPLPGTVLVSPLMEKFFKIEDTPSYQYKVTSYQPPGRVGSNQKLQVRDSISVRVATHLDDRDMAQLRKECFYDPCRQANPKYPTFPFIDRSCQAMGYRRRRGAMCLVATVPTDILKPTYSKDKIRQAKDDLVVGTLEISIHEFYGTGLGQSSPAAKLLYVTEVAVSADARRCGVGSKLLRGVDEFAMKMDAERVYLHVETTNDGAIQMYKRAGYYVVSPLPPELCEKRTSRQYEEFTRNLNLHDEAPSGRRHFLMSKRVPKGNFRQAENSMVIDTKATTVSVSSNTSPLPL